MGARLFPAAKFAVALLAWGLAHLRPGGIERMVCYQCWELGVLVSGLFFRALLASGSGPGSWCACLPPAAAPPDQSCKGALSLPMPSPCLLRVSEPHYH